MFVSLGSDCFGLLFVKANFFALFPSNLVHNNCLLQFSVLCSLLQEKTLLPVINFRQLGYLHMGGGWRRGDPVLWTVECQCYNIIALAVFLYTNSPWCIIQVLQCTDSFCESRLVSHKCTQTTKMDHMCMCKHCSLTILCTDNTRIGIYTHPPSMVNACCYGTICTVWSYSCTSNKNRN